MKRALAYVLIVVVLVGVGYAAYRMGLLERFAGSTPAGETAAGGGPTARTPTGAAAPGITAGPAPVEAAAAVDPTAEAGATPVGGASSQPASGTPIPEGLVAVAQPGQPISNKSIELRVTGHRTAADVGGQTPAAGRQFVIVDSSWKNLIPPQKVNRKKARDRTAGMGSLGFGGGATAQDKSDDEANTTLEQVPFEIGPLSKHLWLVADGRDVAELDPDATNATDGHLPIDSLTIPAQNAVRSGSLAFQVPANPQALSLLLLDSANGHLLVPIIGAPPTLLSNLGGASRSNAFVDLAMVRSSWAESAAPGTKTLVATLRGISRQPALVDIPFGEFSYLQTGQGCIVEPDAASRAAVPQLAPMGRFVPFVPREGQLAFDVPADTQSAMLLLRLRGQAPIDLPVLGDGSAKKPTPAATHEDGKVLRVHVVGTGAPPAGMAPAGDGLEHIVVDYVVENITTGAGAELQTEPQFALADSGGTKYAPLSESAQLPCRLTGSNVVPAGSWRRFSLLYAVPAGQPLTLKYRGFESEGTLKVR